MSPIKLLLGCIFFYPIATVLGACPGAMLWCILAMGPKDDIWRLVVWLNYAPGLHCKKFYQEVSASNRGSSIPGALKLV